MVDNILQHRAVVRGDHHCLVNGFVICRGFVEYQFFKGYGTHGFHVVVVLIQVVKVGVEFVVVVKVEIGGCCYCSRGGDLFRVGQQKGGTGGGGWDADGDRGWVRSLVLEYA